MSRLRPLHAFALLLVIFVAVQPKSEYDDFNASVASCERGNVARASLVTLAEIIQANLEAAKAADAGAPAVKVYKTNIGRLQVAIDANPQADCKAKFPRPFYLPS